MLNLNIQAIEIRYPDDEIYPEDYSFEYSPNPGIYPANASIVENIPQYKKAVMGIHLKQNKC